MLATTKPDSSMRQRPPEGGVSTSPAFPKGVEPLNLSQFMLASPVPGKRKLSSQTYRSGNILPRRLRLYLYLIVPAVSLLLLIRRLSYRSHIPFHHPLPFPPTMNTTFSPTPSRQVPPYVHYIYGLSPTFGGKPFSFLQYLCFTSSLHVIEPERIYFHYVYEPSGWWWETWKEEVASRNKTTEFIMVKQRDVVEVFGNKVEHFAHKADVIRLEVLRDYGGIYLDADVLVIKDFGPLYKFPMVMAMESQPNLDPKLPPSGLCNAVMLSRPYSSFVVRWYNAYQNFTSTRWAYHSVTLPYLLAQSYPLDLIVLNKFAFFWPIWHDDHLRLVHRSPPLYDFHQPDRLAPGYNTQFTYHLWESEAWERYLKYYDPERIWFKKTAEKRGDKREEDGRNDESSFSREARRFVSLELRIKWRKAVKEGKVKEREWEHDLV
ncbi:BQ5605_C039g11783 [Microbotryum silenes-dioicae]|uniref:BQ5605_C039g11783 protein n=1 Tax=Microbotryum silenes-dioicae TaxID=796604 RepID=A0A2X0PGF1_9BASI|nr:BQ5605_C039g11783 [Microbotryum silenes-dioicae]